MKKFYTPVDLRSRADMTAYLENHFRYPTMNSWNQATSYACNLKVDRLGLSAGIVEKLLDMLDTFEFQEAMQDLRTRFGKEHEHGVLETTTDKLLIDFVTKSSKRVSSTELKKKYPLIYDEVVSTSNSRKLRVSAEAK